MNKLKKIEAFTLSEMIVVLMITIIVVGLAFSILRLVQGQMRGMETNYERGTELNLLRQALWIDFTRYREISYNENSNRLHFENELKAVDYVFEGDRVIREKDTFNLKLATKLFYFDGLTVQNGPIDAMDLLTSKAVGSKKIFIYKANDAKAYMD
ncbi:hypothetical protein SB49_14160 [Sediminicola sp. YIK13]|uniref:PulJ/GspJ family protein n=1 Tax=Sediminicola sp. YIK13 TaxID=1453352 RepID=UPI0007214E64|nr:hypothetical protein [Sediminicola sp. YIK13]ALM08811.1 hypothetical protein SB49_14160 [Sediminicola sp. YIK13]